MLTGNPESVAFAFVCALNGAMAFVAGMTVADRCARCGRRRRGE